MQLALNYSRNDRVSRRFAACDLSQTLSLGIGVPNRGLKGFLGSFCTWIYVGLSAIDVVGLISCVSIFFKCCEMIMIFIILYAFEDTKILVYEIIIVYLNKKHLENRIQTKLFILNMSEYGSETYECLTMYLFISFFEKLIVKGFFLSWMPLFFPYVNYLHIIIINLNVRYLNKY